MTYTFSLKIPASPHYEGLTPIIAQCQVGCPIRRSLDQSPFPAPQSLSQGITSFIASCCQGIHQTPFSRLIRSRERKAGLLLPRPQACPHPCGPPPDQKSYISPPRPAPREGRARQRLVYLTWNKATPGVPGPLGPPPPERPTRGTPKAASMFSLHDVTSSSDGRTPQRRSPVP